MKKIIRHIAAIAGFIVAIGGVGSVDAESMDLLSATILMVTGRIVTRLALLWEPKKKAAYKKYDSRDELIERRRESEQMRKAAESWESIKEANR